MMPQDWLGVFSAGGCPHYEHQQGLAFNGAGHGCVSAAWAGLWRGLQSAVSTPACFGVALTGFEGGLDNVAGTMGIKLGY